MEATQRPDISPVRLVSASAIGLFVEWFDFGVFALSASALAHHFFPAGNATNSLLLTFATFAVAFVIRPIGGIILGTLGDKIGRSGVLALVVSLMGLATLGIGLVPSYATIGIAAPILVVFFRLIQGFSAGGENAGAFAFLIESATPTRRGLWGSVGVVFNIIPAMVAAGCVALVVALAGQEAYLEWAWRIPFILGGIFGLLGFLLRRGLVDSQEFVEARREQSKKENSSVLGAVFRDHRGPMILIFFLGALNGLSFYLLAAFVPSALVQFADLDQQTASATSMIALGVAAVLAPFVGIWSDKIGRRKMLLIGAVAIALVAIPVFVILLSGAFAAALTASIVLAIAIAVYVTAFGVAQVELLPAAVRYTGVSVAYNIAYVVFAGTAPMVSTFLISKTGWAGAPGVYLTLVAIGVALVVGFVLPKLAPGALAPVQETTDHTDHMENTPLEAS